MITENEIIQGLSDMIKIPAFSGEEDKRKDFVFDFLKIHGWRVQSVKNNVFAFADEPNDLHPNVLMVSHIDTVKPNKGYTVDPFSGEIYRGSIHGLGTNDAGGCVWAMIAAFQKYIKKNLPFNLIWAAVAEEEISGVNGIGLLLQHLPRIAFAIVGEPTSLAIAVAEKGLMVVDVTVLGNAGHSAHIFENNAIVNMAREIVRINSLQLKRTSNWLGDVKITPAVVAGGHSHNALPDSCNLVIDIRTNECYTHGEILDILRQNSMSKFELRSDRLKASALPSNHYFFEIARRNKWKLYASPTLSDCALMPCPAIKVGPGQSARSHTSDEFILIEELREGIAIYEDILMALVGHFNKIKIKS